jgi:nucleoside-diphosphate-sugar epimerase
MPESSRCESVLPRTRNGAIRVELERRLQAATARGARVIIVRAGDFFGPRAGNNWFSQASNCAISISGVSRRA